MARHNKEITRVAEFSYLSLRSIIIIRRRMRVRLFKIIHRGSSNKNQSPMNMIVKEEKGRSKALSLLQSRTFDPNNCRALSIEEEEEEE